MELQKEIYDEKQEQTNDDIIVEEFDYGLTKIRNAQADKALVHFKKCEELFGLDTKHHYYNIVMYNIACCYSLKKSFDEAMNYLKLSVLFGYNNSEHMNSDPDFDNLKRERGDSFSEIIYDLRNKKLSTDLI